MLCLLTMVVSGGSIPGGEKSNSVLGRCSPRTVSNLGSNNYIWKVNNGWMIVMVTIHNPYTSWVIFTWSSDKWLWGQKLIDKSWLSVALEQPKNQSTWINFLNVQLGGLSESVKNHTLSHKKCKVDLQIISQSIIHECTISPHYASLETIQLMSEMFFYFENVCKFNDLWITLYHFIQG